MNTFKTYVFNPLKIATDRHQLTVSTLILAVSVLAGMAAGFIDDGIYHATFWATAGKLPIILTNITVVLLPSLLLYIISRLFNPKTRLVDIWNTVLFARLPLVIANTIFFLAVDQESVNKVIQNPGSFNGDMLTITVAGLAGLPFLILSIIILVNGFKTATNAKKLIHYGVLAVAIIVCEIVYRSFFYPFLITL